MAPSVEPKAVDLEVGDDAHLANTSVHTFAWQGVSVTVQAKGRHGGKEILAGMDGCVRAGEMMALMGPSGCGKTTLLNVLAHRHASATTSVDGSITVNGTKPSLLAFRKSTCYVEQEVALIGALTVRETINFAARLSLPSTVTRADRRRRVDALLSSFGLQKQADTLVGTPLRKGVSGGQKRRTDIASQIITGPKILFLDEPTSGLDAVASYEVVKYLRQVAKKNNLIIIASIHQPSTSTFDCFDKLLLLSGGRTCYNGPLAQMSSYFSTLGFPIPAHTNPAEYLLQLTNVDFAADEANVELEKIQTGWEKSDEAERVHAEFSKPLDGGLQRGLEVEQQSGTTKILIPLTLIHRGFLKSFRDVVPYGIRIAMYCGLAIMMGTVWLRLHTTQSAIQPFTNALFFGSAFISFMAVAYVPSYLEDRATFLKERHNGLYSAPSFLLANFCVGIPYLFTIALLFSSISYWLVNFRPAAPAFASFIMWLFLDLLAAESLVVAVSSATPTFVVALVLTAFANGLWMAVGGFLVTPKLLNVFWRYVFSYIDYQAYVFKGMMVNEFATREFDCGPKCECMYQTPLAGQCRIAGQGVLDAYGYEKGKTGEWVGILLAIVVAYRLLGWLALTLKRT